MIDIDRHPCFNVKAHRTYGRVHLPVAPRCNIQCNFCNRKFDCVNESRPGVSSGILTPKQAMVYLDEVFQDKKNIAVVGIAGPGDPFANPEETMETLRLVRQAYPEILLCVASNGLELTPHLDELADLKVGHVTVTVNAVDPAVGAGIYSWVRYKRRVLKAEPGAEILWRNQLEAIRGLKERNITVKINSILIPGINDDHMEDISKKMAELGVDIQNCVPYYPNEGSAFAHMEEPPPELVSAVRVKAGQHLKQMQHCTRCRADAAGLLGEAPSLKLMKKLQACESLDPDKPAPQHLNDNDRPYVAVASMEGLLVNQHLGEADRLLIYGRSNGVVSLVETRQTPARGLGDERWSQLADMLGDCRALLVGGVGDRPRRILSGKGPALYEVEGLIDEALGAVYNGDSLRRLQKRTKTACGAACSGNGAGCG